jgi:predicted permease
MAIHDRLDRGESRQEARESVRREFGNVGLVKEVTRDMWGWRSLETLFKDIGYGLSNFRESPTFTITAVLTLALGIGGTTAIFSLIHAVMLRSLPVADPASLYRIGDSNDCCEIGGPQDNWGMYSFALYKRLKAAAPEFEQLAAFNSTPWQFSVRRAHAERIARPLNGEFVTGNYFSTFGIQSFAGRLFSRDDDQPSATAVAVLSYRAWRGMYGGDPAAIGSTFVVNNHPFVVIGIAPPGFFGETVRSDPPDIWLPLHQEPLIDGKGSLLDSTGAAWLRVIGRLRPGATVAGMSARLTSVLRQWIKNAGAYPAVWMPEIIRTLPKQTIRVIPAGSGVEQMKEDYGRSLNILFAVCGLVLLIACANVANLLVARGMARRGDIAVRVAIGASARRLVCQALTESILLSITGGSAGLAVAYATGQLLLALAFQSAHFIPIGTAPSLGVLGFAFGLSLLTGIVFGTAPAWFATRTDPMDALRGAHRSAGDRSSFSRNALLVLQGTLSVVLVAGAAMLARSLSNLEHQNFGFPTANRIAVQLKVPQTYAPQRLDAVYRTLEDHLHRVPGVERIGLAGYNPFTNNWDEDIVVAGHPVNPLSGTSDSSWDRVSTGYFEALGEPILRGRGFAQRDTNATAPVAVVNQAFVKRFFPHEDPMDKHFGINMPENANTFRIVGVVRDAKFHHPKDPAYPMFFVPLTQYVRYELELGSDLISGVLLETHLPPGAVDPVLHKTFAELDPNFTIVSVRTLEEQVDMNFDQQRAVADLASLFGLVALVLAGVGLYGASAYNIAQRTSEIGIRVAVGADRASVVRLVLRGAFKRAAIGLLLGIPLAVGAGRLISSQLYGVEAWDPLALFIAIASLAICAFFAAIIPGRRAALIEPMSALRME